ncbi:MAG TPA: TspO/MBR family protein [Caulobacteraceae bacterium]
MATSEKHASRLISARHQAQSHVLAGVTLTVGAMVIAALAAARNPRARSNRLKPLPSKPPPSKLRSAVFALIWPPLFMALTLSGLRIWNGPPSPARTRALTLWGLIQAFNATWMALGPKRLGGQLIAAVATLGAAAAYAWQARRIDAPAASLASPYLGWIGFANVLTEELWRRNPHAHTVH